MNLTGVLGRTIPNWLADRYGTLEVSCIRILFRGWELTVMLCCSYMSLAPLLLVAWSSPLELLPAPEV